ncbi:pyridoxal phosphate homeostasis protein-like [Corticium candelabrum]|uniref:pyridoxal phosphate homeostasis protein-like n=1 Tax=Corticium candelabrum TaxID=121492 RepID=UPI002E271AD8|nr:pyridoxal phosphate homeostasis protein-like [Corticium candelabrum]
MASVSCETVATRLAAVLRAVNLAATEKSRALPRVVAVCKTKPVEDILEAYRAGQRHFGENYVRELILKSEDKRIVDEAPEIKWHFIGHLQSNKCNAVAGIPNLWMVETVDSQKLADTLNSSCMKQQRQERLRVLVQVNTSCEERKSGCNPDDCVDLARHIIEQCDKLRFCGLMTIGQINYDYSQGPNPDFQSLIQCHHTVSEKLGIPVEDLEVSMGMSADYDHAIDAGSTNVRIGSTIFGAR